VTVTETEAAVPLVTDTVNVGVSVVTTAPLSGDVTETAGAFVSSMNVIVLLGGPESPSASVITAEAVTVPLARATVGTAVQVPPPRLVAMRVTGPEVSVTITETDAEDVGADTTKGGVPLVTTAPSAGEVMVGAPGTFGSTVKLTDALG
jgi:hypothetical protein